MFTHEKFTAYQKSIDYWAHALEIITVIPTGNAALVDQYKRAAMSIPLNIAEGTGRSKLNDRERFYAIARGSALECAAISDILVRMDPEFRDITSSSKIVLEEVVNILSSILLKNT